MKTYTELREKALDINATAEDRLALFFWMEQNAMMCWNGECFNIGEGLSLFPVHHIEYDEDGEIEEVIVVDAEIKY